MCALKISMREADIFPMSFGNRFKSKSSNAIEFHETFFKAKLFNTCIAIALIYCPEYIYSNSAIVIAKKVRLSGSTKHLISLLDSKIFIEERQTTAIQIRLYMLNN